MIQHQGEKRGVVVKTESQMFPDRTSKENHTKSREKGKIVVRSESQVLADQGSRKKLIPVKGTSRRQVGSKLKPQPKPGTRPSKRSGVSGREYTWNEGGRLKELKRR